MIKKITLTLLTIAFLFFTSESWAQAVISWSNTGASTAWLTNANWTGNAFATTGQIAQFNNAGTAATAGINMGTQGGSHSLAGIDITSARTANNLTIGNSSSTNGTLSLTGGLINAISNVIIRNNSAKNFTIQDNETGTGKIMGLSLGNTTENKIFVDGVGNITIGSAISSAANRTLSIQGGGAGVVKITGSSNTFSGTIMFLGGETEMTADGSFGTASVSPNPGAIVVDGGRMTLTTGTYVLNANRGIKLGSGGNNGISVKGTGLVTYNGIISNLTSNGNWSKQGANKLILGGSSIYTGSTSINNGTLQIATGNDRLPTTTTLNLGQAASANVGIFDLNGFNQQIAGLVSTAGTNVSASKNMVTSATSSTLTINAANNYTYGVGTAANSGLITGAVSIVKSGTGIQTLGDINTYTGVTQINAGELRFCPSASESLSSSAVTLNGGTLGTSGITAASVLSFSTLNVANNSTISLSSASAHTVNFASSNALSWTPSTTLVVTGWQGTYNSTQGSSGTFGKIFVGANATALTSNQLSKIRFFDGTSYYYATLLSTGELVPFLGTKLTTANCAYTSTSTTEFIWADSIGTPSINTANRYRFLIINGANSFTWTTNNEWPIMQFYLISGIANGTTYTTSVAWSSDGGTTWSPFGPECNLTSPSSSTTQLTGSSCGSSPASINTIIYANVVPNATQYQYQLINSSLSYTQSIVKSNNNFILSQFTGLTNNTTYSVTVRVNMGSGFGSYGTSCNVTTPGAPTTQLTAGSCGSNPASYNTLLFADAIGGATQYQYKLMNTSLSYTQTYIKSNNNFILSQFTNLQNNTTYSVTVCVYFNSAWQPYGSSCNVSTPGSPTTQLTAGSCGSSPASYNTLLFADAIGGATQYEYRLINSSLSYTQSFVKTNNNFNLAQFSGLANGTTYSVSVRVNLGTGFGNYGSACNITTPSTLPTTDLQPSYCSYTAPTFSTIIFATAVSGATQYEYRLINSSLSYTQSFVKTNGNFNLSLFTGLVLSTTYTVQVRVCFNSAWGPYGSICNVTTPASASPLTVNVIPYLRLANTVENESIETVFDAMVYPNPYTQHFAVNLSRYKVNESVSIRVFDATGKLIEQHSLTPNEVSNLNLGAQYSAGIYNVVVSQAGKAKSIKVVKP